MKTGIFIFTKQYRKEYLKNTLYFLFKNYNHQYNHDVYILTTDYNNSDKEEILLGIRDDCQKLVKFKDIKLEIPDNVNKDKLSLLVNYDITTDWYDIEYRNLTYYMLYTFWDDIGNEFDYVMKLNDDTIIEEPIKEDFFKLIDNRANNLLFCMMRNYCSISSFGMYDLLKANVSENVERLDTFNSSTKIVEETSVTNFKKLHKTVFNKDYPMNEIELKQPMIPNDAFMVIRASFMTNKKILPYMNKIKDLGYIHYFKWSFSLVVSSLAMMICNDKVTRCVFKASEERNRCAYKCNGKLISNIGNTYKKQ